MSATRHDQLQQIFTQACRLDPAERDAFIDGACGDDVELRAELDELLSADAEAHVALDVVIADGGKFLAGALADSGELTAPEPKHPERLGRYRILGVLGRGGMGIVYEAEQDDPKRRVALKVVRHSMVTPGLLSRFRHEGRVMGHLRHPGIAQIYEAGTTDTGEGGQPFFAMELVEGPTLTEYAISHDLDTHARLGLIAQLCDILDYAHQKGVIHRDLKPSNILVTDEPGTDASRPSRDSSAAICQLTILDFGVARATDADLQTVTLQTTVGQLVGTVPYMSPEQVSGDPEQIDVRSDVYSAGVLTYELLVGRLPYDVRGKLIHEAVRIIREEEPSSLSAADRSLRGDVETIVAKALEKDKTRRYQSAADFAADIRRHLRDEPISAQPTSAMYQVRSFTRRNKAVVGGAVATLVVAVIGTIVATSFAFSATRRANALERQTYIAGIAAASSALGQFDDATARQYLDQAPGHHRGWEYDYLRARLERHTQTWTTPAPVVTSPQFDEQSGHMVAMMSDGAIGTWETASGRLLQSLVIDGVARPLSESAGTVKLHLPSGCAAVATANDGARIASISDGRTLGTLPGGVRVLAWNHAGSSLLYTTDETRLWTGEHSRRLSDERFGFGAFNRAGDHVVLGSANRVLLVEVESGATLATWTFDDIVLDLEFAPNDRAIAVAGHYKNLLVLNARTLEVEARLNGHNGPIPDVAWTADSAQLASVSADGTMRTWSVDPPAAMATHELGEGDHAGARVAITPDDRDILVASSTVMRFPLGHANVLRGHESYVYHLAFSPDGSHLASVDYAGSEIRVWDVRSARSRWRFHAPERLATMVAFSGDGRRVVGMTSGGAKHWNLDSGESLPIRTDHADHADHDGGVDQFHEVLGRVTWGPAGTRAISPGGHVLALCRTNGFVDLFAWSAPLTLQATGFLDPGIRAAPGEDTRIGRLAGHVGEAYCAAFSPDGSRIATGGIDSTVRIWDAHTCEQLLVLRGHGQYVYYVAFSPDGTMLASASGDTTVRLWDTMPVHERRAMK